MFANCELLLGSGRGIGIAGVQKRNVPRFLGLLLVATALAGCEPVQSLYPFFDTKDVIFEPHLVGQWIAEKSNEKWTLNIARADERLDEYVLRYSFREDAPAAGEAAAGEFTFDGHLFRADGATYLDLLPQKYWAKPGGDTLNWEVGSGLLTAPTHTVYRVWIDEDHLSLAYLDDDRVKQFVSEKNLRVATESPAQFLLTASTKELQSEILAPAEHEELLDSDHMEFLRQSERASHAPRAIADRHDMASFAALEASIP
jgi:hypothetical protein